MGKKLVGGLFAGLLGAGLYAAYQKLDENRKHQLKRDLKEKTNELRDRAVDYAFYANDAVSDFKDAFKDEFDHTKSTVKDASSDFAEKAKNFKSAKEADDVDHAAEEKADQDDIIVDARDAFGDSDYAKASTDEKNAAEHSSENDSVAPTDSNGQTDSDNSDKPISD